MVASVQAADNHDDTLHQTMKEETDDALDPAQMEMTMNAEVADDDDHVHAPTDLELRLRFGAAIFGADGEHDDTESSVDDSVEYDPYGPLPGIIDSF